MQDFIYCISVYDSLKKKINKENNFIDNEKQEFEGTVNKLQSYSLQELSKKVSEFKSVPPKTTGVTFYYRNPTIAA